MLKNKCRFDRYFLFFPSIAWVLLLLEESNVQPGAKSFLLNGKTCSLFSFLLNKNVKKLVMSISLNAFSTEMFQLSFCSELKYIFHALSPAETRTLPSFSGLNLCCFVLYALTILLLVSLPKTFAK